MNVERSDSTIIMEAHHRNGNIGIAQRDDGCYILNCRLLDTDKPDDNADKDVSAMPEHLCSNRNNTDGMKASDLLKLKKNCVSDQDQAEKEGTRPTSPLAAAAGSADNNSLNLSLRAEDSIGSEDFSHMTSITLELRKAAKKTICHAKSKRAVHAAVPLEVKEAMLAKEFPHIRTTKNGGSAASAADSAAGGGEVDSMLAEHSSSSLDQVVDERATEGLGVDKTMIDYNNCVTTLTTPEMLHLRNSMYNYMEHLSQQMKTYHELLDEHALLKDEMKQVREEKDNRISELEESLIEMKLNVAHFQEREDHHRLSEIRLQMDLKKARDENKKLCEKLGARGVQPEKTEMKSVAKRRDSVPLTKSLSSANEPGNNVRNCEPIKRKNPLLTRSWFGKDGLSFLDRSFRREDSSGSKKLGASGSPLSPGNQQQDLKQNLPSSSQKPALPTRSHSFIDPKKAREKAARRASKEFEFMPWNGSECSLPKSDDEGAILPMDNTGPKVSRQKHHRIKSCSFVEPKKARSKAVSSTSALHGLIGSDVFFESPTSSDVNGYEPRSTILSNITDITFEDGDTEGAKSVSEKALKALFKESLLAKSCNGQKRMSRESLATLEFEPAKPQLQKAMSLRNTMMGVSGNGDENGKGKDKRISRRQLDRNAMSLRDIHCQHEKPKEGRPQLQKAASLRGRNKDGKKTSSGDAYLAFC